MLRRLVAGVAVAALLPSLAACSLLGQDPEPSTPAATAPASSSASVAPSVTAPPADTPDLAPFYEQRLDWEQCDRGECADLRVPLNYAEPDDETIVVKVNRVVARNKTSRGSIVVNPGGPGGSGIDYAFAADFIVGPPVRRAFDVVGFDPRGVGRSVPIQCISDDQLDAFLGMDPTPDDATEEKAFAAASEKFAETCGANGGELLAHVSTADVARDMDILRAALGEPKLNYLGKSYGTFLGATYAELFPTMVGAFVLDGVAPPDLTSQEINLGQAEGFERATRAWAADCVSVGCPLGGTVDEVMTGMAALLKNLDANPAPVDNDAKITELTEGWASLGIAAAMYDQGRWLELTEAFNLLATTGSGNGLMDLANSYADRTSTGRYTSNLLKAIWAVNCLDRRDSSDPADYERAAKEASETAPTWGPYLAWSSMPCGFWPVRIADDEPRQFDAEGSGPIVVVGTTRDPATPYEWSVRLRNQLDNAVLVTMDGDGHTAYMRQNNCIDKAIDAYYLDGTVPADGLTC